VNPKVDLRGYAVRNSTGMKTHLSRQLSLSQQRSVSLARAYFHELYFLFFREPSIDPLLSIELTSDILLPDMPYLSAPGCMCGQVLLRCIRSLRTEPEPFAEALLKNWPLLPVRLFAFTTFASLFQFYTGVEGVESASLFILALLHLDAPDELLGPLFLSLLFGTFPFVDALWGRFHRLFSAKPSLDDVVAISGLCGVVESCAPLVPSALGELIREMLGCRAALCAHAILELLKRTFDLWFQHCPEGMSFASGASFSNFLAGCNDFRNGSSLTVAAAFTQTRRSVPVYPFNCELCGMSAESIILSHQDFATFRKAFEGAEQRGALFKAIEVDEQLTRFAPYLLDFFPNIDRRKNIYVGRLIFSSRRDTLFDPRWFDNVVTEDQQYILDLEDFFRLRLVMQNVHRFQKSIERFRNAMFSRFCGVLLDGRQIRPQQMAEVAASILKHSPREDRALVGSLLPQILNMVTLPELPEDFHPRFWDLQRQYLKHAWDDIMEFPGCKHIIELVPEATRRPLALFGDVFVLFSHLFSVVRKFAKKHGFSALDDPSKLKIIKFVSLNCQFGGILKVFLFFDKLVFQNNYFIASLNEKLVKDWNSFSQMMWSTIVKDVDLSRDISTFAQAPLPV
jgi:hypothetical protein